MARKPTPRPPGEHLATLTRILRQVEADERLQPAEKSRIKTKLGSLMADFQKLLTKG